MLKALCILVALAGTLLAGGSPARPMSMKRPMGRRPPCQPGGLLFFENRCHVAES